MEFEAKLYNPAAQPEQWLIEHFVVRTKVFENIFKDISTGDMKHPEQHYLIQGQRGMGKTTLLLRLKYEIERTDSLKDWLVPVFFNEESYDLTSLSSLWEKLLKFLDDYLPDGGNYYKATDNYMGSSDYEQKCFRLITDILHKHKKKLVILFDNFGELFLDNLNERDSHRFREILITSADIRIVAASAVVLESHNDYSEPFFDFFRIINLEGLSKDETVNLIIKLQERSEKKIDIEANKARIDTLAVLTGGVIRTIIMLYDILLNDADGSAIKDLEKILDVVTPLYKHRMEDLKPQQRRIMDVIAKNWDAISVKDIASSIRDNGKPVASKIISAQLQELEKNNLIEKVKTSTKNHLYIVRERFFNIWYLMRHGDRTTQCKVKWLTSFLEMWYQDEHEGMDKYIKEYIGKLQSGKYIPASAVTVTNALLFSSKTSAVNQALLLDATQSIVSEDDVKYLTKVDERKIEKALEKINQNEYISAIEILEEISPKNLSSVRLLANAYFHVRNDNKVIELLSQVPRNLLNDTDAVAMGLCLFATKKYNESLPYLVNLSPEHLNRISYFIGCIYFEQGKFDLAEKYLLIASKNDQKKSFKKLGDLYINYLDKAEEGVRYLENYIESETDDLFSLGNLTLGYYQIDKKHFDIEYCIDKLIRTTNNSRHHDSYIRTFLELLIALSIYKKIRKIDALKIIEKYIIPQQMENLRTLFIIIWNNRFDQGLKILFEILNSITDDKTDHLNDLLILLLSKKQYHSVLKIFNENTISLKDKLKPTYYALMQLLKDEYPDEHIKMGRELEQPVKDILKTIEQYAVDYA